MIRPGEAHSNTLAVFAVHPDNNYHPKLEVQQPEGTYRLLSTGVVHSYDDSRQGFGDAVDLRQRVSNDFTLRR